MGRRTTHESEVTDDGAQPLGTSLPSGGAQLPAQKRRPAQPAAPAPSRRGGRYGDETATETQAAVECATRGLAATTATKSILSRMMEGKKTARAVADEMVATMFLDLGPTTAIERMLCEQLVMTHAQIIEGNVWASTLTTCDERERMLAATSRLMADHRATVLAFKAWRSLDKPYNQAHLEPASSTKPSRPAGGSEQ